MKRAPYTPCKLYVDGIFALRPGDFLVTNAGSAYLVQSMRQNSRRPHRRHLQCMRWPREEIPPEATVHEFIWYKRKRRRFTPAAV